MSDLGVVEIQRLITLPTTVGPCNADKLGIASRHRSNVQNLFDRLVGLRPRILGVERVKGGRDVSRWRGAACGRVEVQEERCR